MLRSLYFTAIASLVTTIIAQKSTLPDVPQATYNVSTRIEIDAPIEAVWNATIDFAAYPSWNPFVRFVMPTHHLKEKKETKVPAELISMIILFYLHRSAVFCDNNWKPLPANQQRIFTGAPVEFKVQLPPINLPVSAAQDSWLNGWTSQEKINNLEPAKYRVSWINVSNKNLYQTERWTVLSKAENGKTVYESRITVNGIAAKAVELLLGTNFQKGIEAQGKGLKMLLEKKGTKRRMTRRRKFSG